MELSLADLMGGAVNPTEAINRSVGIGLNNQATQQNMDVQAYALQQAQQQAQQQQAAQQAYQSAVGDFVANPSANGAADLALRFPDQAKNIQASWTARNEAAQASDRQGLAMVYSSLQNDRADLAQSYLEQRLAADQAAGKQEPMVQTLLDAVKADPAKAKGIAAYVLSSIPGGEDFAKTLRVIGDQSGGNGGTHVINEGGALVDDTGKELYHAGKTQKYMTITNGDGSSSIVAVGGSAPSAAAPPASAQPATGAAIEALAQQSVPGLTVTSRARTPEHNAAVGGVPKSYHLTDEARDFVPPAGMPVSTLAAKLRDTMPGYKVLDEGTHVHVQPLSRNLAQANHAAATGANVLFTSKPSSVGEDAATIDFYAQKVAAGGDMPTLGMGKQAALMRQAILARAAKIQTGQGMTGADSNLLHADVKTATTALAGLQKTRNSLDPYLQTFDGNVAQVQALAPKGVAGGIPVFNRWVQAGRTGIKGDPDVAKFNVAINAVANENAKIMSGATGGAVSSDSARNEAMSLINNAQTYPQLMAALQQMQTDTRIRVKSLDDRQAALRAQISGKPAPQAAPHYAPAQPAQSGPIRVNSPADVAKLPSGTQFITHDGRLMVKR